jgi:hypothetical protein
MLMLLKYCNKIFIFSFLVVSFSLPALAAARVSEWAGRLRIDQPDKPFTRERDVKIEADVLLGKAEKVFERLKKDPDLALKISENGCEIRAMIVCASLEEQGIPCRRIRISPRQNGKMNFSWGYHWVAVIDVAMPTHDARDGYEPVPHVMDPTLFDRPVTIPVLLGDLGLIGPGIDCDFKTLRHERGGEEFKELISSFRAKMSPALVENKRREVLEKQISDTFGSILPSAFLKDLSESALTVDLAQVNIALFSTTEISKGHFFGVSENAALWVRLRDAVRESSGDYHKLCDQLMTILAEMAAETTSDGRLLGTQAFVIALLEPMVFDMETRASLFDKLLAVVSGAASDVQVSDINNLRDLFTRLARGLAESEFAEGLQASVDGIGHDVYFQPRRPKSIAWLRSLLDTKPALEE